MESGRANDPAVFGIHSDQRSTGFQGLAKKHFEDLFLVAVFDRMLLPNEGIRSDGVKFLEILRSKRPEFEQPAFQNGLEVKSHS